MTLAEDLDIVIIGVVKKAAILPATLLCVAVACAAIATQEIWTVHQSRPGAGTAGITAISIVPIASIPNTALDMTGGESKLAYVKRVTDIVHLSTFNCQPSDFSLSWLDRIFLALSGNPSVFSDGVLVKDRFVCGFCHQRAFLVHQALQRNGIESDVFGLNGHVVARVSIEGKQYYTDPDYGVGPFAARPESLEDVVRSTYLLAASGDLDQLSGFYTSAGDNGTYDGLDARSEQQAAIFQRSRYAVVLLLLMTVLNLLACVFLARQSGTRSPRPIVGRIQP
ncbi:hypothetical protein EN836_26575 [Mesorhizobium sp. M1C.F.Ca.ET.193.01.1.1]|uniref:hypothetical protein n=1 Tax=unclassified Mesorhizobium TaxID=325217 RepID=UPI000FD598DC|nr:MULTISPECIES: hypothetical protein [unclassified Mesorhizobium]TGS93879.1 hypothetical protein EN820_47240 [bacterium M00.F.Ca.ET.177.01.1.1]TGQ50944.1 hypothetical protein EN853_26570 [Mesorhizobium sp. M1C.F.Ca.ET.210.01.1.1]TGQ66381.1 hypothetical protein EN855_026580 [Mesorhizobium sp. M1C.F.Ca.ET.212.01.1.1]TGR00467.1 hypothetical protein EN847_26570 [Mesorhizobium sp. M1C.F.Ca.ET.204.01.1.1]TGR21058.1 hypothetical protein EN839_26570 [Mesorhizobium sp. M1C.F.Ca.ET.196.01.1.1]